MDFLDGASEETVKEVNLVMPESGIPLTKDGGLYKVIINPGVGDRSPTKGNKVKVHYTGTLENGTEFDSSVKRGEKFVFNIGKGEVIKAWDIGVATMKKNEKCEIVAAPKYGYGARGSPPKIPSNAILRFVVELFEWEGEDLSEDHNKGIVRELITEGTGYTCPNDGASVSLKLVGKYQDNIFDDREVNFFVSELDDDHDLVPAINRTVKHMKLGETCLITVQPDYGYGVTGSEKHGIPPNAVITYELTLKTFEKAKEAWEMTDDERIEESKLVKEKGTAFLKQGKPRKAIQQYGRIIDYLEYHDAKPDGSEKDRELLQKSKELKLAGYLNLALCHNKLKEYGQAIIKCQEALKLEPSNEKALYRIADAHYEQKMYTEAKEFFAKVLKVNPKNKTARLNMEKCSAELKRVKDEEKAKFRGMFDKFSKEDEEAEVRKKVDQQKEKAKAKTMKKEEASETDAPTSNNHVNATA